MITYNLASEFIGLTLVTEVVIHDTPLIESERARCDLAIMNYQLFGLADVLRPLHAFTNLSVNAVSQFLFYGLS